MGKAWLNPKSDMELLKQPVRCMYHHVGGCWYYQLVLKVLLLSSVLFIIFCLDWVCSPGMRFL